MATKESMDPDADWWSDDDDDEQTILERVHALKKSEPTNDLTDKGYNEAIDDVLKILTAN